MTEDEDPVKEAFEKNPNVIEKRSIIKKLKGVNIDAQVNGFLNTNKEHIEKKVERNPKSLIQKYVDIARKYTDAPITFLEAGGYYIISTLLGQFFRIKYSKAYRPNFWSIIASIPGRMRRSEALNLANHVVYCSTIKYLREHEGIQTGEAIYKYRLSDIETGSPEGICDSIEEGIRNDIHTYQITSTEFGGVLKKITGKGYEEGVDNLLSKLYYGEQYNQKLSQRGNKPSRFIEKGQYVTMYSAMQEPGMYLTESMSRQGLLRRMCIIWEKPEDLDMKNWKPPLDRKSCDIKKVLEELEKFAINDIVPLMLKYCSKDEILLDFTPDVEERINADAMKADEDLINDDSDLNIHKQTKWEHQLKLSALEAIAEGKTDFIDYTHLDSADYFLKRANKNTPKMMESLAMLHKEKHTESLKIRIRRKIRIAGSDGIIYSDILNAFPGLTTKELRGYISTLLGEGAIYEVESAEEQHQPGRVGERFADIIFYKKFNS
jgi:hypothetical protein